MHVPAADANKKGVATSSDPYLRLRLHESEDHQSAIVDEALTQHQPDTASPSWHEQIRLFLPATSLSHNQEDLSHPHSPLLKVAVWDKDVKDADDLLCEATLTLGPERNGTVHHIYTNGEVRKVAHTGGKGTNPEPASIAFRYVVSPMMFCNAAPESDARDASASALVVARTRHEAGAVQPAGRVVTISRLRAVDIPDVEELAQMQSPGKKGGHVKKDVSDPYCVIALVEKRTGLVHDQVTTPYIRNSNQPAWTGMYRLMAPHAASLPLTLSVAVWDKDWKSGDDLIGDATIELDRREGKGAKVLKKSGAVGQYVRARPTVLFEYAWKETFHVT